MAIEIEKTYIYSEAAILNEVKAALKDYADQIADGWETPRYYVDFFSYSMNLAEYLTLVRTLEASLNTLNLPNHQTCFHTDFRSYYNCESTDKNELLLVLEKAIELLK